MRFKAVPISVRAGSRPPPSPKGRPTASGGRLRDWIATVPIAMLAVALIVGEPSHAATPTLTASGVALAGHALSVSGTAFPSGEAVQLTWDGSPRGMPKLRAGANGAFAASVRLHPKTAAGSHRLGAAVLRPGGDGESEILTSLEVVVVEYQASIREPQLESSSAEASATAVARTSGSATAKPTATPPSNTTPPPTTTPSSSAPTTSSPTSVPQAESAAPPAVTPPPVTEAPDCGASLQSLVNGAGGGATLRVPACTYRETVVISKPITLVGSGARIDGQRTRKYAFVVKSDDVTIDGFEITGTTNPAQEGAIQVRSVNRFTLRNSHVHNTDGACVSIGGGAGHRIANNELAYCDQQGFHLSEVSDTVVIGNKIHHNNPNRAYDPGWEAGAGKAARAVRLTFEANVVYANRGPGLWCDIDCRGVTYRGNAIFGNEEAGIFFEISDGAVITGNSLWENGWGKTPWGWGAGILISSSRNVDVSSNTLAWNADGISVISQNRAGGYGWEPGASNWNSTVGIKVHDNVVALAPQSGDSSEKFMVGWLQDWSGVLFASGSGNSGSSNRYWHSRPEPSTRFAWNGGITRLTDFEATPGESSGSYLSKAQIDSILTSKGIPVSPASH